MIVPKPTPMRYHYVRALLFSQFNSKTIESLTGWKEADVGRSNTATVPSFHGALNDGTSLRVGSTNFSALSLYSALVALSDATLSGKVLALENLISARRKNNNYKGAVEFPNFLSAADYFYWTDVHTWTLNEGILLSLGLKPEKQICLDFDKISSTPDMESMVLKEFRLRRRLGFREAERGGFNPLLPGTESCVPLLLFNWFEDGGFPVPKDLHDYLKSGGKKALNPEQGMDSKTEFDEEVNLGVTSIDIQKQKPTALPITSPVNPKAQTAMLTIIHAFGQMRQNRYDPDDPRNGAILRIQNAIADAGLEISDRTLKKYLKEAWVEAERLQDKSQ